MGGNVHFHDQSPHATRAALRDELLAGLRATPKSVSPKLLYDRRGSALFDRICEQPEYYPTRTEEGILTESVTAIAEVGGTRRR
ncbi:L-histidine N(alpha)-methyltransferase [Modicisalibacter radicis]|uniref:L-histidine N(alpha)-methyltransferase n=1 Tax=Halomonas sp. EAR18 TaxID=2518972 RepID=UPI00245369F6|nr:L-histidine N(alpha)-methyltransferase [Halomonas sp. EAR18]